MQCLTGSGTVPYAVRNEEVLHMADDVQLPYMRQTDPSWVQGVNTSGQAWLQGVDGLTKVVACPRCQHSMQIFIPLLTVETFVGTWGHAPPLPHTVLGECNCMMDHPGCPPEAYGCGQRAEVAGPGNPSQTVGT